MYKDGWRQMIKLFHLIALIQLFEYGRVLPLDRICESQRLFYLWLEAKHV